MHLNIIKQATLYKALIVLKKLVSTSKQVKQNVFYFYMYLF